jgi:hypothetical protein
MQGSTDEASVAKTYVIDSRRVGVTMRRKKGTHTFPFVSYSSISSISSSCSGSNGDPWVAARR